jgi:hypothetical protein
VASIDPDIMHYDQAMKQPDEAEFAKIYNDKIVTHHKNGLGKVVEKATRLWRSWAQIVQT